MRRILVLGILLFEAWGTAPLWALRLSPGEYLPVSQVRPGMTGVGYTVFEGTRIEPFGVVVLGVLEKVDFGTDLILVRITSGPVVEKGYGVIAGMSGSPVFIEGKIVGALAYAFSFSKVPIAGLTPIEQMVRAFSPREAPPEQPSTGYHLRLREGSLAVEGQVFRRFVVAQEEGLLQRYAQARDTMILRPIMTPIMVSGLGSRGLRFLERLLQPYHLKPIPGPGGGKVSGGKGSPLRPGAAIGTQLAKGDIDLTAIGTLTYVKGKEVLAYGHPVTLLGQVDMPMTSAYIHTIVPSLDISFKMGSPLEVVGAFTQDRSTCAGGELGRTSDLLPASFEIVDEDRGVHRVYRIEVIRQKELMNGLLYSLLAGALATTVSEADPGATTVRLRVRPEGFPPIERQNTFSAANGGGSPLAALLGLSAGGGPLMEMVEVVETLTENRFRRVRIQEVEARVQVSERKRVAAIERAFADRDRVKPGEEVRITLEVRPYEQEPVTRQVKVRIPQDTPSGRVLIGLTGGTGMRLLQRRIGRQEPRPETLEQLLSRLSTRWRNDALWVAVALPTVGLQLKGEQIPDLPTSVSEILRAANDDRVRPTRDGFEMEQPLEWVLQGMAVIQVMVESEEKDKVQPPAPAPAPGPPGLPSGVLEQLIGAIGEEEKALSPEHISLLRWQRWFAQALGEEAEGVASLLPSSQWRPLAGGPLGETTSWAAPQQPLLSQENPPPPDVTEQVKPKEPPEMPKWEEVEQVSTEPKEEAAPTEPGRVERRRGQGLARAPQTWIQATAKDFSEGKLEGTYVTTKGEVALAPSVQVLAELEKGRLWALAVGPEGSLYAGSWIDAVVLRISPQGEVSPFFQTEGLGISALAFDEKGNLYAAVVPSGKIYRVNPKGEGQEWSRLEAPYIWALAPDGKGGFYAATGPEGKVFHLEASGKATLRFQCGDRHAFALVTDSDGTAYVGTYPKGKVYRLPLEGAAQTLFEVPKAPVHSLALDRQGNLFVGTAPEGIIYRITPQGLVEEFYKAAAKQILSLLTDQEGNLYAAAADKGGIYLLRPDRTAALLYKAEDKEKFVLRLASDGRGNLYAATAGPVRILRLGMKEGREGTYTSPVLDAQTLAFWGRLEWEKEGKGIITLQTRSGNTAYPDAGWSEWSEELVSPTGSLVPSPPGRYFQYRARFYADENGEAPRLRQVRLFYFRRNRPPQVEWKTPTPGQVLTGTVTLSWSAQDPDRDKLTFTLYFSSDGGRTWTRLQEEKPPQPSPPPASPKPEEKPPTQGEPSAPPPPAAQPPKPAAQALTPLAWLRQAVGRWVASMTLGRFFQDEPPAAEGEEETPSQEPPKEETPPAAPPSEAPALTSTTFRWNTEKVPDGRYWLKVIASDKASNPVDAEQVEVLSESFFIDNTPPLILAPLEVEASPPLLKVTCYDATTYVASAEYRWEGGEWVAAACSDGIFDSPYEEVVVRLDEPLIAPRTLELRVRDGAGNERLHTLRIVPKGPK